MTVNGNYNRKGASRNSGDGLITAIKKWPTLTASDYRRRGPNSRQQGLADVVRYGEKTGQLNPDWAEPFLGYPIGWTDIDKDVTKDTDLPAAWLDGSWEDNIPRLTSEMRNRRDRIECLGNAVVPQIPELIWRLILCVKGFGGK